jgi:glycogen debranching enzyme
VPTGRRAVAGVSQQVMAQQGRSRGQKKALTPREKHERKMRVQTHGRASVTRSIAVAVVIKGGDLFFLTEQNGDVPSGGEHGFGLYYHDCRYLNGHEMRLADAKPENLAATARHGFMSTIELTNTDIHQGDRLISKEDIGIRWDRILDDSELRLHEVIAVTNYGDERAEFPLSLSFESEFEDIYAVCGLLKRQYGKEHRPEWKDGVLFFLYDGGDNVHRSLSVSFSPESDKTDGAAVEFQISLSPEETKRLLVTLRIAESRDEGKVRPSGGSHPVIEQVQQFLQRASDESVSRATEVRSDSALFDDIMNRSLRDLHALKTKLSGEQFFAAGVPWFVTLFGRDSIVTSLQTLAYDPHTADDTLRLLSKYQGREVSDWRDEQPGKIMHELRVGEMAHMGEIPETPYYGTVDATPLFLILLSRHAAWTGSLELFNDLRPNVEAALEWMAKYGDANKDGYIEYESASGKGLIESPKLIVNRSSLINTPRGLEAAYFP